MSSGVPVPPATRTPVAVRPRRPDDLPVLGRLLLEQQPDTGYPYRNPLPIPAEDFLARPGDLAAWVAELDGAPAGHVSVGDLAGEEDGAAFVDATGRRVEDLARISALFVGRGAVGRGAGSALLDAAEGWCREQGRVPVLDVFTTHERAYATYLRRGWVRVGHLKLPWMPDGGPDLHIMVLPDRA